jgi:hypothetical protein
MALASKGQAMTEHTNPASCARTASTRSARVVSDALHDAGPLFRGQPIEAHRAFIQWAATKLAERLSKT